MKRAAYLICSILILCCFLTLFSCPAESEENHTVTLSLAQAEVLTRERFTLICSAPEAEEVYLFERDGEETEAFELMHWDRGITNEAVDTSMCWQEQVSHFRLEARFGDHWEYSSWVTGESKAPYGQIGKAVLSGFPQEVCMGDTICGSVSDVGVPSAIYLGDIWNISNTSIGYGTSVSPQYGAAFDTSILEPGKYMIRVLTQCEGYLNNTSDPVCVTILPAAEPQIVAGGHCGANGDNLTWTLDETGLLTISGTGAMEDYSWSGGPWYAHRESVLSVRIEDGVTRIGDYAFYNLRQFTEISIPDSVLSIGKEAFYQCFALESVTIPASVAEIAVFNGVFFNCRALTAIHVASGNKRYCSIDGVLIDRDTATLLQYPAKKPDAAYTVPSIVEHIGRSAFYGCFDLKSVVIPGTVKTIEAFAFENTGLTAAELSEGLERLENCAFQYSAPQTLLLPASLTWIHPYAFFGSYVKTLEAAEGNPNYTCVDNVLYTKDLTTLCWYCGVSGVTSFTVPSRVTRLGNGAFAMCGLREINLPDTLLAIGESAFQQCYNLTGINIPGTVEALPPEAFLGCENLREIILGDGVKTLGDSCFSSCPSLREIELPASVDTVDRSAFSWCSLLGKVTVRGKNTELDQTAFSNCAADLKIYGLSGSKAEAFASQCGYPFVSIGSPLDDADFILPAALTDIRAEAFAGIGASCVILPETAASIGERAFAGCLSLTAVYIPAGCGDIAATAFEGCPVTVYGFAGSEAEAFAARHELPFIAVTSIP